MFNWGQWASVDRLYRAILFSSFFDKGWGSPKNIDLLFKMRSEFSCLERRKAFLSEEHKIKIVTEQVKNGVHYLEGEFLSPLYEYHPGLFEPPVERARFQMVIPDRWPGPHKPICIHMAGTGDHSYWRRRELLGLPLLRDSGIGFISLTNPYYGDRKPKDQFASRLKNVTDLFVMGGSLIFEGMTLLNWCRQAGYGPLCLTGLSMGGHMASLAASHWPLPVALVPCLSWSTASQCFTEGVLSNALDWAKLREIYFQPEFQRQLARDVSWNKSSEEYGLGRYFAGHYHQLGDDAQGLPATKWGRHINASPNQDSAALEKQEVLDFMKGVMDEFTHLSNYPSVQDDSLIVACEAENDAYIPRKGVTDLRDIWPNAEFRFLKHGHVANCVFGHRSFQSAIKDAIQRTAHKYYSAQPS